MTEQLHITLVVELSRWIENHLGRAIQLPELAAYSGYSLWYMQKVFKEISGYSLGRYIRERRLMGALRKLRFSEQSLFDIAIDFGFGSQSHFCYMFKKRFGCTPSELRSTPTLPIALTPPLHEQLPQAA
ncbi:helix-turn-helix domain-containing protein [Serratia rubidaea]|uniref:Helix-turn-helix domain-containing protein n=1 Tax=Serratia rubidaea TaxID=61652 RepID=A0A448STS7_SERRU|nr:helix-turn-helix domain-containing protein [Serratia rubidaea]MBH1932328.1 helix-turn-helix domain-containing protein [Serratia rubidaea]MDC6119376.1 helix-turn-helix domain-containing protein [Serratia rubidaea]MEB7584738.1 helix-turn-helix domain-containing protein [Serratia rubidaea]VEI71079.1 Regulatory protein soxS [Serratia rubidaea]